MKFSSKRNPLHERILNLWAAKNTYPEIADVLEITEKTISNVLWRARKRNDVRAVRRGNMLPGTKFAVRPWTESEIKAIVEIKRKFPTLSHEQIGQKVGRTARAVRHKLNFLHEDGRKFNIHYEQKITVPDFVEELRDQRICAPARDLTGLLMNDPPVGFSALDRRVAA